MLSSSGSRNTNSLAGKKSFIYKLWRNACALCNAKDLTSYYYNKHTLSDTNQRQGYTHRVVPLAHLKAVRQLKQNGTSPAPATT